MLVYGCSSKLFTSGATYGICCMVAETIYVICSEHSYRHGAPDLAVMLMLCTCLLYSSVMSKILLWRHLNIHCLVIKAVFTFYSSSLKPSVGNGSYYAIIFLDVGLHVS